MSPARCIAPHQHSVAIRSHCIAPHPHSIKIQSHRTASHPHFLNRILRDSAHLQNSAALRPLRKPGILHRIAPVSASPSAFSWHVEALEVTKAGILHCIAPTSASASPSEWYGHVDAHEVTKAGILHCIAPTVNPHRQLVSASTHELRKNAFACHGHAIG